MRDNGTDRDIALSIVAQLGTIAEKVSQINDNLYVPHITTQPTNQIGAIGDTISFTVVANNVASYQWQVKPQASWINSSGEGNNTDTLPIEVTTTRYGYKYRCQITGKDGSIIYTNEVQILQTST